MRRGSRRIIRFGWKGAIAWYGILAIVGLFLLNGIYQVIRKPGEIFAPVSAAMSKSPESTWQSYGPLFEEHSTSIISPEFLAALAQVESDGNPIARTYWRWQWSWNPFEIYRPASSALGMFQFTDGTFAEARRYCIRDHKVTDAGPWYDVHSCWFNGFYTRTMPSHSIEMTAAYLHQSVIDALAMRQNARITVAQKQKLAAVIHLCGAKRGEAFVKRGLRPVSGERCGTHSLSGYLSQIDKMKKRFSRFLSGTNPSQLGPVLPVISGSPS
jgi:Transglycosylase SLT domain